MYNKNRDSYKEFKRDIDFIKEIEGHLESYLNRRDVTRMDMVRDMLSHWKSELELDIKDLNSSDTPKKRCPDKKGVLPLTSEELEELSRLSLLDRRDTGNLVQVQVYDYDIIMKIKDKAFDMKYLGNYKAIKWSLDKFELEG